MSNNAHTNYERQVRLLIEILPIIFEDPRFALKGGTALNLFVRDLPRFSVDIDLTYLPLEPRDVTITNINGLLETAAKSIAKTIRGATVIPTRPYDSGRELKLIVETADAIVKVEANYILRGSVLPCSRLELVPSCRKRFAAAVSVNVMSFPDLYGGKICAALDRQHPRDLFDVKLLLENEGLSEEVRQAFLVYLMSHNRPMSELLDPNWQDLRQTFTNEFSGMTVLTVTLDELLEARDKLLKLLHSSLSSSEREFLLAFKARSPDWGKFPYPHTADLPGIKWKQHNLAQMTAAAHSAAMRKLERVLALSI